MKYRTLGKTGLKIAEVGIGTWQLADDPNCWVGADLSESLKSLYRYVDLGGNFIDTAWIYGYDDKNPDKHPSEELIRKYLKESGNRENLIIASKIPPKNMQWPVFKGTPIEEVFPADHIEKCVDDSLLSLGIDTLDLMQFHVWQDDFVDDDDWQRAVEKITKAGKVKFWGISANDYQPSNCIRALDTGLISTVQFIFNIFHQKPTEKLLPYAEENNIGLIARVPLDEGGLTGKFTRDTKFEEGDFRSAYFSKDRLSELVDQTDKLKSLLNGETKTLVELALRYILSWEEISTVIPGMRKVAYVESNTAVSDGKKLSEELMKKLQNYAWERNFYDGHDPALSESNFVEA